MQAAAPAADFGSGDLADNLRALASVLPVFKAQGIKRQVFLVSWAASTPASSQLGSTTNSQDTQLAAVGKATAAFDQAMQAGGLGDNVVTLMMSDFGRTLRPALGRRHGIPGATTGLRSAGRWPAARCTAASPH